MWKWRYEFTQSVPMFLFVSVLSSILQHLLYIEKNGSMGSKLVNYIRLNQEYVLILKKVFYFDTLSAKYASKNGRSFIGRYF